MLVRQSISEWNGPVASAAPGAAPRQGAAGQRPRVLIIEDERPNRRLLVEILKDDYDLYLAPDGLRGLRRAMAEPAPDLILLDIRMPYMDGYHVLEHLRSDETTSDIPVIVLTAFGSTEDELRGLKLGAVDFIAKPFSPDILLARLANHLDIARQRRQLAWSAAVDPLTGLANRRHFDDALERAWRRCLRSREPLSVAIVDVDHFKLYNDHYGHAAGDDALRAVAACLDGAMRRPYDLAARYGGEEFVLVMPSTDATAAACIAEAARARVEAAGLAHARSACGVVTLSVGGATIVPESEGGMRSVVEAADQALYQAKRTGRNRISWAAA